MTIVNKVPENERFAVTRVLRLSTEYGQEELQEAIRLMGREVDEADKRGDPSVHQLIDTLRCIDHIGRLRFRNWGPNMRTLRNGKKSGRQ